MSDRQSEKRTRLPRNVKEMSKDELEETIKKKKECDAIALSTVEHMLDNPVDKKWFLDNLKYIRHSHFTDVVEERSIVKLCGYPLCCKTLASVPRQQYHISLKAKKVYDTTDRKKFCSSECYNAANYLQEQLLTSPLWFPEEIPTYKLLSRGSKGVAGSVIHLEANDPNRKCSIESNKEFTLTSEFAIESLSKVSTTCTRKSSEIKNAEMQETIFATTSIASCHEVKDQEVNTVPKNNSDNLNNSKEQVRRTACSFVEDKQAGTTAEGSDAHYFISKENLLVTSLPECVKVPIKHEHSQASTTRTVCQAKPKPSQLTTTIPRCTTKHIETNLREWCNLETLIFLFGETKVKAMIVSKGRSVKEYNQVFCNTSWNPKLQDRYDKICKRLNLMELDDMQFDEKLRPAEKELKPLPSYQDIQEDGKKMELKVNAFFQGKVAYVEDTGDVANSRTEVDAPENLMPLVDTSSQKSLRRKIVLDKLKPVFTELLRTCNLGSGDIIGEVRALVTTFSLEAHNITYKPLEWSLLAIIIMDMLTLKDTLLKKHLDSRPAKKYRTLVLSGLHLNEEHITSLVNNLTDLDNIIRQKTD